VKSSNFLNQLTLPVFYQFVRIVTREFVLDTVARVLAKREFAKSAVRVSKYCKIMTKTENLSKKIKKVVINVGVGRKSQEANFKDKILPAIIEELGVIAGQKPAPRPAKKSIAGFKIREGGVVGLKVTLRKNRMRQFMERLINIVLPRVRDFRGIDHKAIDARGNLNIGLKEHLVFPEISPEHSKAGFGLQITVIPGDIKSREEAFDLYKSLGFPLKKGELKKI
jgi:large subunit ribosomal protein L5